MQVSYEASDAAIGYVFRRKGDEVVLEVEAAETDALFHVLLPAGTEARSVTVQRERIDYRNQVVENSPYVDFRATVQGGVTVRIALASPS